MKKRICILITCVVLLLMQLTSYAQQTAPDTTVESEIVILLDQSGSMKTGYLPDSSVSCASKAGEWTQELCLLLAKTPVSLRVMTFDEICERLIENDNMAFSSLESLEEDLDKIRSVEYNGEYTDHLCALKTASGGDSGGNGSENSSAKRSYVIISDGLLDIPEDTQNETNAVNEFQLLCKELSQEGNCIYLIGLGTELDMFNELNGIEGITVMQNEDVNLIKLSSMLLSDIGYTVNGEDALSASRSFRLTVNENYEKIIINISGSPSKESELAESIENHIYLSYCCDENGKEEIINVPQISSAATTFLYLDHPEQREYIIHLPAGKWEYRIRYVKKAVVHGMNLSLLVNGQQVSQENGIYNVADEDNLSLSIQVVPLDGDDLLGVRYLAYELTENGGSPVEYDISDITASQAGRIWQKPLVELKPDTQYTCRVKMRIVGQEYLSPAITIKVISVDSFTLSGLIGETISSSTCEEMEKLIPIDAEDIAYIWNGEEYHCGDHCSLFMIEENGGITFHNSGNYQLELIVNAKKTAKIEFIIDEPDPISSLNLNVLVVVGIIIITSIVIVCAAKKNKITH